MAKAKANLLKARQKKLLYLALLLERRGKMATSIGLRMLANGVISEETAPFKNEKGFGCLQSLTHKAAAGAIRNLVNQEYLEQTFVGGSYFLKLTSKGREEAFLMEGKMPQACPRSKTLVMPVIIDII